MPGYRNPQKIAAYETAQNLAGSLIDSELEDQTGSVMAVLVERVGSGVNLPPRDVHQVVAEALRIERRKRMGLYDMARVPLELHRLDRELLDELCNEMNRTRSEVLRVGLRSLHAETFETGAK